MIKFQSYQNVVSRSVTIILAYLLFSGMNLKSAFALVSSTHNTYTHPNIGFCKQLLKYKRELYGINSLSLPFSI